MQSWEISGLIEDQPWPESYHSHPVVLAAAPQPVLGVALYVDGVPFLKKDSVTGWWVVNLLTGKRHLCAILRKSRLCKCGCQGWCSVFAILSFLAWSVQAMQDGTFPLASVYDRAWDADDARSVLAGTALIIKMVLVNIKGDWSEYAHTLGFPT